MPVTRYARAQDGVHVAYQRFGDGPIDLILVHAWLSNIEVYWEWPGFRRLMQALARHARVIHFDKRGMGLSDGIVHIPTFEARMDDILAVMDAAGVDRAALLGYGDGAALSALFAATFPECTLALILQGNSEMRLRENIDEPLGGFTSEEVEVEQRRLVEGWGDPTLGSFYASVVGEAPETRLGEDPAFGPWFAKLLRHAAGPSDYLVMDRLWFETDATAALPAIQVPTAVYYRERFSAESIAQARWLASRIPGAELVPVAGYSGPPWEADFDELGDAVGRFLASVRHEEAEFDRVLATVLFTDIVDSTRLAAEHGDRAWKGLVEDHHRRIRALLGRYRGREIDTAGDGFFASFDGPVRAVRCAAAILREVRDLGIEVRAGVHTGEVETIDRKVGGLAVVIGSRVASLAGPSEVLVSRTVKDLTAGSGLVFEDAGEHELKSVPDRWRLYRVVT